MATWPLPTRPVLASLMRASSTVQFVTITGAAAHAKGAWTELVASTPFAASSVVVTIYNMQVSGSATDGLIDIGIGAASSEVVVIPDLGAGFSSTDRFYAKRWTFPLAIPSGARIAARLQSLLLNDTALVSVDIYGGEPVDGVGTGSAVDALGADSLTSKGVAVTSASAANTFGAWTQLIASTTRSYRSLGVAIGGNASAGFVAADAILELGVGGAGAESALAGFGCNLLSTEAVVPIPPEWVSPRAVSIPSGSRVAARLQDSTTATKTVDVIAYGVA